MSSSNSAAEHQPAPDQPVASKMGQAQAASSALPDYAGLVRFLIEPFLESPESLKVDCEISASRPRVLIRVAFEGTDRGKVFGRGGRNIQAIRTVLTAFGRALGYAVSLDIYGSSPASEADEGGDRTELSVPRKPRGRNGSSKPRSADRGA